MRIGLPLVVATLTLGGYKYAERLLILNFLDSKALGLFSFGIMVSNEISILFKASIKVRLQDIYLLTGSKQFLKVHRMVLKETFILTISSIFLIPIIWIGLEIFVPLLLDKYTTAIPAGKILSLSIPFLVVSNYAGAVTTSKLINKIYFPITTRIISIIIFAAGTFLLFQYNALSLVTYSILNVVGYAFYNLAILFNYYYSFYKKYVNIT